MKNQTDIDSLKQRAKLPVKQSGGRTVAEFFSQNRPAIEAVLPNKMSPDRMLKVALHALRTVPQLTECTSESLFGAVIQAAQLGLELNTVLGHAYLIPFRNRKARRTDVQMIIGYKGLIDLARRSGQIVSIAAHEVCEKDRFDFAYGLEEKLQHTPVMSNRGPIVAFYAVAHLEGGGHAFEVMSREEVDQIKVKSLSRGEYGPWKDHYPQMGRKTVIRRLSKFLPLSVEFDTANALDSMAETGQDQGFESVLSGDYSVMDDAAPQVEPQNREGGEPTAGRTIAQEGQDAPENNEKPPQWPSKIVDSETGETGWGDSSGHFFQADFHSMSADGIPAVKKDGTFRRRRGKAQPQGQAQGQAQGQGQGQGQAQGQPQGQPQGQGQGQGQAQGQPQGQPQGQGQGQTQAQEQTQEQPQEQTQEQTEDNAPGFGDLE